MLKRMIIFLLKLSAFGSVLTVAVTTFVGLGDGLEHSGVTVAVVTVLFYSWAWLAYSLSCGMEGRPKPNPVAACLPYLWCLFVLLPTTDYFGRLLLMGALLAGSVVLLCWHARLTAAKGKTAKIKPPVKKEPQPYLPPKEPRTFDETDIGGRAAAKEPDLKSFISRLRYARAGLKEEALVRDLIEIEAVISDIDKNKGLPGVDRKAIQKISDYYLPTLLKILRTYSEIESNLLPTKKSESIKEDIRLGVADIRRGFRELYNSLFETAALDTSAELSVLKNRMSLDGMVRDFEFKPDIVSGDQRAAASVPPGPAEPGTVTTNSENFNQVERDLLRLRLELKEWENPQSPQSPC